MVRVAKACPDFNKKKCHIFITRGVVLAVTMTFQSNVLNQLCIPSDNLLTCRSDDE